MVSLPQKTYTYNCQKICSFLSEHGVCVSDPRNEIGSKSTETSIDEREMHLYALGINPKLLKKYSTANPPVFYLHINLITIASFLIGLFCLFGSFYLPKLPFNSTVYITWCLCSLSMYFTNKLALKDWKKSHGEKK